MVMTTMAGHDGGPDDVDVDGEADQLDLGMDARRDVDAEHRGGDAGGCRVPWGQAPPWASSAGPMAGGGRRGWPMLSSTTLALITSSTDGHRAGLGHGAGHVGEQDDLEHGQPGQDAEAELVGEGHEAEGDHGDDAQPAEGVDGQRAPLVLDPAGADLGHRVADHPEVEGAEPEADAGPEARATACRRRRRPPGRPRRPPAPWPRCAGHVGNVGQFEVGEHGGYTPVRTTGRGGAHSRRLTRETVISTAARIPRPHRPG